MKILIGIAIGLVLAIGGWFAYNTYATQSGAKADLSQEALNEGDGWALEASFSCTDNSHFIASFPAGASTGSIIVDGETTETITMVEGAGQRFENDAKLYVFAGEEVTVTDKKTGKSATCTQPVDPNNAPVNFGDRGEGGGEKQDLTVIVSESIVGKWQSTQDAKFVREFKDGGKAADWYDNEVESEGTWKVFTKEKPLPVPYTIESDAVYIQMVMAGSQPIALNFKLVKLTPDELVLIYMERGGTLTFKIVE